MLSPFKNELPRPAPGRTVGLLGGSFDPPHAGHLHISHEALKRFGLGQVWWLVSPGNPLKTKGPAPLDARMAACSAMVDHPRIRITDYEARIGTRATADTLAGLFRDYPGQRFVWLMGADNLATFHRWERWEWIMRNIPIGVIARPDQRISALSSPAARRYRTYRIRGRDAARLCHVDAPAWCFINTPMIDISSTAIRARGYWHG